MRAPQVINPLRDNLFGINGYYVIDDTTQTELGKDTPLADGTDMDVRLVILNLTDSYTGATEQTTGTVQMKYLAASDYWIIDINQTDSLANTLVSYLEDGKKYVARIEEVGGTYNMRPFNLVEFSMDEEGFEKTLMTLPYQIEKVGPDMYIRWYDDETDFGGVNYRYQAKAYTGGSGITPAESVSEITHRGAVEKP